MKKNLVKFMLAPVGALLCSSCNFNIPLDGKVTVVFKNYDGTVLKGEEKVNIGSEVAYTGKLPRKPATGDVKENVFIGWDNDIKQVKKNTVFTAQYKEIKHYEDKDHDGIPEGVDTDDNNNHFDVTAKSFVNIEQNINIDFSFFLKDEANTTYNNDLAKLGLFLSNPKIDFRDGLFDEKVYGGYENAIYARLGFDDFTHFDFKDDAAKNYTYDPRDTTSGVYGHKYLYNDDGSIARDLIVIAFEGTNGKNRWASNFDVGYNSPDYYAKAKRTEKREAGTEADHPEWTDKDFHKGFYIAAHRVLADKVDGPEPQEGEEDTRKEGPVQFLKYIEEHSSKSNGKPIVFVTGHSRGGAMANIVGEHLQNRYKDDSGNNKCIPFTYAYAAPSVWGGGSAAPNCESLFNILNEDDLVTMVPFSEWGFSKIIGKQTITKSVGEYKELYDAGNERKYQWIPSKTTESIFHNVGCESRKEIYEIDKTDNCKYVSNIAVNQDGFSKKEDAEAALKDIISTYAQKLGDFSNFVEFIVHDDTILEFNPKFNIYPHACLGTVTALIGCLMTNDEKIMNNMDYVIPLVANSRFIEMLLSLGIQILPEGKDKIALPHDYGAYHILLREYKGE